MSADDTEMTTFEQERNRSTGSGLHPVNTGHLVMGLAFLGLVAVWAIIASDVVSNDDIRWLMPVPWVVGGAVGHGWGARLCR